MIQKAILLLFVAAVCFASAGLTGLICFGLGAGLVFLFGFEVEAE